MKAFNKSLLEPKGGETLKRYWEEVLLKCTVHKFAYTDIYAIAEVLNKHLKHDDDVDLSNTSSSYASKLMFILYYWHKIDRHLPNFYTGQRLQRILKNENF